MSTVPNEVYMPNVAYTFLYTVQGFEIERSQRFWFLRKNVNTLVP